MLHNIIIFIRVSSLSSFKVNTMLVAQSGYKVLHEAVFGEKDAEKLLPISEDKLKSYYMALFDTG